MEGDVVLVSGIVVYMITEEGLLGFACLFVYFYVWILKPPWLLTIFYFVSIYLQVKHF